MSRILRIRNLCIRILIFVKCALELGSGSGLASEGYWRVFNPRRGIANYSDIPINVKEGYES
jgi:hypothetical protein